MRPALATLALLTLAAAPLAAAPTDTPAPPAADLPIHRVTLYTSGVGYFERSGAVDGDATQTLLFPVGQVNDVLKSLVLLDAGGGSIRPVTYAAQDPLGRQLQSFSVDLSRQPGPGDAAEPPARNVRHGDGGDGDGHGDDPGRGDADDHAAERRRHDARSPR